jgi:medium-chain acyl-[acyl-carrier-protein] hydrolase
LSAIVPNLLLTLPKQIPEDSMALVCFPYAGGNPYMFLDWRGRLGPQVEVIGIQLPGRGARLQERPYHSVTEIADETVRALAALQGRPFVFYGHSLGALIAFEVTRRLRALGKREPSHLFVGGARPPHMGPILPHLHTLEQASFLDSVQARYGGIPAAILREPELLDLFLPPLRADFAAYETYEYAWEDPLTCPISAFAGVDDPLVTPVLMAEWSRHSSAGFDLSVLRGDHFFLGQSRDELVGMIRRKLPITF